MNQKTIMNHVEIVADIGINHNGDINLASTLVDACAHAGADVIKFQTVDADRVYKKSDPLHKIFKKNEFTREEWIYLKQRVEHHGKEFLSTPGDMESADFLEKLGVKRFKIASDSAKNIKFVNYILDKNKPVIVSMGMFDNTWDIKELVLDKYKRIPDYILHCVSEYPTPIERAKLMTVEFLSRFFSDSFENTKIGYSDHVVGYDASVAAVATGAMMIEKHIKWNDNCVDAIVSLDPKDFGIMVEKIRNLEKML